MSSSAVIHTRIDPKLKKSVEAILKKLGMTSSEAIRMFFAQISTKKRIPFSLDTSSHLDENGFTEEQVKAILQAEKEANAGKNMSPAFTNADDAIAYLRSK